LAVTNRQPTYYLSARCLCPPQIMFVLFVVALILWSVIVVKASPNAHRIHHLMIVLVTFKALTLLSQARGCKKP